MNTEWKRDELEECGGYDCMTAGIRIGPVLLDGAEYGQEHNEPLTNDQRGRMLADAAAIAALPELIEALRLNAEALESAAKCVGPDLAIVFSDRAMFARAALAKATRS